MRFGTAVRPIALALAGFYLVASGRAMVPDLCATLRALEQAESGHCAINGETCCTLFNRGLGGGDASPGHDSGSGCAFCHLAKALVTPTAWYVAPQAPADRVVGPPSAESTLVASEISRTNLGRDPPRA